jgi:broad specificity phosphatase PhoE
MKLYFARHGESTANVLREFCNTDGAHPLTETGVQQATALALSLREVPVTRIIASPILRARQTAQILGQQLGLPVETDPALREWSVGIYEGTRDPAGWALHSQVQEDWFARNKLDSAMPGGESFLDMRARFVPFIGALIGQESRRDRHVVLVAHGGLYLAMLPLVLNNVDAAAVRLLGFPHTACVTAEARPDGLHGLTWCGTTLPSR